MTDVKVGDTVRVVLEGPARFADHHGALSIGASAGLAALVYQHAEHVKSVEVVKRRQPKVGDTVRASRTDVDSLPLGTVLSYESQTLRNRKYSYFKTMNGWKNTDGFETYMTSGCDLTVEYIPT